MSQDNCPYCDSTIEESWTELDYARSGRPLREQTSQPLSKWIEFLASACCAIALSAGAYYLFLRFVAFVLGVLTP
jgi:hypothetical protein